MRICILGHRGMLGHVVFHYLTQKGYEVFTLSQRFSLNSSEAFLEELKAIQPNWCINCIGASPKTTSSSGQLFEINSFLPKLLSSHLPSSVGIIQASTDAVFNPLIPNREANDTPDAVDDYGLSKRFAEEAIKGCNRYIIRCSIIGLELGNSQNLMNWFLSQKDTVSGYTNHCWNGITTLEWAKLCCLIINKTLPNISSVIVQPSFLPSINKKDMLVIIGEIWNHPVKIASVEAEFSIWRTLIPNIDCPHIYTQLLELKSWYLPTIIK